jgi:hypothetical protein
LVGREADAGNPVAVTVFLDGVLALGQGVPQLDGLVAGSRDDLTVVSGEGDGENVLERGENRKKSSGSCESSAKFYKNSSKFLFYFTGWVVGSDPLGAPQEIFHGFQPCLLPRIGAIGGNFELLYTRQGSHRLLHPPTQIFAKFKRQSAPGSYQIGQQINSHLSMVFETTSRLPGGQIPETESLVPRSRQSVVTVR